MKILLVYSHIASKNEFIYKELSKLGYNVQQEGCKQIVPTSTFKKIKFVLHYFLLCTKVLFKAKSKDIIVHRLDLLAIMTWWISYLTFRQRKIVCCNVMLKKSSGIKWKILKFLYRRPILANNFVATVTSKYYGEQLKQNLEINVDFPVLHDDYGNIKSLERNFEDKGLTVFGGGNNGRDWNMYMKVAKRLPDVSFYVAMPKSVYEKYVSSKPSNVSLFTELSGKDFFELQSNCSLTFLPLASQAPSGLIVLFSAALMERPVIMTKTVCSQEYVDNGVSSILNNTEEEFTESITDLLSNSNKRKEMAIKLKDQIKEIGSPESYIRELSGIINGLI